MPAKKPTVVYGDNYILGVNKPAGMLVHPDGSSDEATLTDWLVEKYPEIKGVGEPQRLRTGEVIKRPGIVHRLDSDTSGVMVVARTQETFQYLKEQFKNRKVKKIYNCFVYGGFPSSPSGQAPSNSSGQAPSNSSGQAPSNSSGQAIKGEIDRPIGKHRNDFRQWSAQRGARGKLREALTEYKVIEQGRDPEADEAVSYLQVRPKTGRTHQIRVHLKAIHHQVVCDPLYAASRPCLLGFTRLALHSRVIALTLPGGEKVKIKAKLPEDFKHALEQLES